MFASKAKNLSKMIAPITRMNGAMRVQNMMQLNRMNMMQSSMINMQMKNFASFNDIEKAVQKLDKALESELKYENENYTQLEDIETFLNESGFQFKEEDAGLKMSLIREVGDKTIEVQFEAR